MDEITINGVVYVPKETFVTKNGLEYVMVRNVAAGVFAGYLESRNGKEVVLRDARRI